MKIITKYLLNYYRKQTDKTESTYHRVKNSRYGVPDSEMSSERNFIGFPSDFADSAYKTRTENLSRNCRRFFREVPASDDDEECAFTCLSRATGGV